MKFWHLRSRKRRPIYGMIGFGLLVVAAFVYAMFQGGFVSWFLFYSIIPVLLYTLAVALYPMHSIEVERHVNQDVFTSGATMRVTVTVIRHSRLPLLFLVVDDHLPEGLAANTDSDGKNYRNGSRSLFFPGLGKKLQFTYTVNPMPRGEYDLERITLKTGDVFGFLQKTNTVTRKRRILVYSQYEEVSNWAPFEQQGDGSRHGGRHFQFDMTSVAGVREYSPGDRLSWLDWKSTARTNKLLTKEFERPLNEDMVVCIDRHADHYDEEGRMFEKAVTVAASMVRFGLRRGSSVGFVSFGKEKTMIPLEAGNDQQWRVFYHLARTQADGEGHYSRLVDQALNRFPQKANVVYITPEVDRGLLETLDGWLRRKQKVSLFLITDDYQSRSVAGKTEDLTRLRRRGAEVYVIDGYDLNEALKAGVRNETS